MYFKYMLNVNMLLNEIYNFKYKYIYFQPNRTKY